MFDVLVNVVTLSSLFLNMTQFHDRLTEIIISQLRLCLRQSSAQLGLCPRTERQLMKINTLRCPVLVNICATRHPIIALGRWGSIVVTEVQQNGLLRGIGLSSPTLSLISYLCREAWVNTWKDGHKKFKIQISKVHSIWIMESVVVGESGSFVKYMFGLGSIVWKVLGLCICCGGDQYVLRGFNRK